MLQHTLDRARLVSRPEQTVTVVAREHRDLAERQIGADFAAGVLLQPVNRDTAAGVFLPLVRLRRQCPDATVVIFPADHFVHPEAAFIETVRAAVRAAEQSPDKLVLLGVQPDGPEPDYGWILPGRRLATVGGRPVRAVRAFVEKPSADIAEAAWDEGGLWNTMIMAVKAETLWRLGGRYLPEVVTRFERSESISEIYRAMPRRNFSSELLQRATEHVGIVELADVAWSDWGREERITETLARIGRRPSWAPAPERDSLGALPLAIARA